MQASRIPLTSCQEGPELTCFDDALQRHPLYSTDERGWLIRCGNLSINQNAALTGACIGFRNDAPDPASPAWYPISPRINAKTSMRSHDGRAAPTWTLEGPTTRMLWCKGRACFRA